eukprot:Rhum_TRINITY_DN16593_c0_g1::Rhum_TRINITY_DN16593_c0_g1_i1::g.163763::m.163763
MQGTRRHLRHNDVGRENGQEQPVHQHSPDRDLLGPDHPVVHHHAGHHLVRKANQQAGLRLGSHRRVDAVLLDHLARALQARNHNEEHHHRVEGHEAVTPRLLLRERLDVDGNLLDALIHVLEHRQALQVHHHDLHPVPPQLRQQVREVHREVLNPRARVAQHGQQGHQRGRPGDERADEVPRRPVQIPHLHEEEKQLCRLHRIPNGQVVLDAENGAAQDDGEQHRSECVHTRHHQGTDVGRVSYPSGVHAVHRVEDVVGEAQDRAQDVRRHRMRFAVLLCKVRRVHQTHKACCRQHVRRHRVRHQVGHHLHHGVHHLVQQAARAVHVAVIGKLEKVVLLNLAPEEPVAALVRHRDQRHLLSTTQAASMKYRYCSFY